MNTKTLGWLVGLGAIATSFLSCSQSPIECQTALAGSGVPFIAQYTVKGTAPACAQASGVVKLGDYVGMEYYHPATADGTTYDSTKATVAIQADATREVVDTYESVGLGDPCNSIQSCNTDADCANVMGNACSKGYCVPSSCAAPNHTYAYGAFESENPNDKNFCPVVNLAAADQKLAGGTDTMGAGLAGTACTKDEDCQIPADPSDPMSMPDPGSGNICDTTTSKCVVGCRGMGPNTCVAPFGCTSTDATAGDCKLPADEINYNWSNVQVYVTAAAQGTQFQGDLTITDNGCAVDYTVVGMWPAIECTATDMDGNPTGKGDDTLCNPCTSGINPNFATKCAQITDDGHFFCVLDTEKAPVGTLLPTAPNCNAM